MAICDLRFECVNGTPDLVCGDCGLETTSSAKGLILLTMMSDSDNWMEMPGFDWSRVRNLRANSASLRIIKQLVDNALSHLRDYGISYEVETEYYGNNSICINIYCGEETPLCFDGNEGYIIYDT